MMKQQHADREQEGADGGDQVEPVPAHAVGIGVDAPRHAQQAGDVHREEAEVEADEHRPEIPAAQALVQQPAGHFGKPVIDRADHRKDVDADQHVVDVRDDEIGVGQLPVDRHASRS